MNDHRGDVAEPIRKISLRNSIRLLVWLLSTAVAAAVLLSARVLYRNLRLTSITCPSGTTEMQQTSAVGTVEAFCLEDGSVASARSAGSHEHWTGPYKSWIPGWSGPRDPFEQGIYLRGRRDGVWIRY